MYMLKDVYMLTESEASDLIYSAGVFGGFIGLLIGLSLAFIFLYLFRESFRRNFKMYLLELSEKERKEIYDKLNETYVVVEKLSKSNTRLFKTMHNDLCRLKAYLSMKYMQN